MNPVIIIPTFITSRNDQHSGGVTAVFDHATQLGQQGELPRCLASLEKVDDIGQIIVLVVSDPSIAQEAEEQAQAIISAFPQLSIALVGEPELNLVHQRLEQLGLGRLNKEIALSSYAAIRNLGFVLADTLGFDAVVFLDDDAVVEDEDFLKKAVYGLGKITRKGVPILAKTGYYLNARGSYLSKNDDSWYNRFWEQSRAFNKWISKAMKGPRLSRSNHVCGGILAIHREAFKRLSFDPWITRGEDLDYMLDLRMYGADMWFDNTWWMRHLPPRTDNEGTRFRQDIYRWLYEYRKIEYSRTQIDLLQIKPASLEPYPGPMLASGLNRRIRITAFLRSLGRPDKQAYREAAAAAKGEAELYAQRNCAKYFEFQSIWPEVMARMENDTILRNALIESVEQRAYGVRRSVYINPAEHAIDAGSTSEIHLNVSE